MRAVLFIVVVFKFGMQSEENGRNVEPGGLAGRFSSYTLLHTSVLEMFDSLMSASTPRSRRAGPHEDNKIKLSNVYRPLIRGAGMLRPANNVLASASYHEKRWESCQTLCLDAKQVITKMLTYCFKH